MAGLDRKKTGTKQTSWEFYIEDNNHWLSNPLRADAPGELVGPDGVSVAYRFAKNEPIQILNTRLENVEGKQLAKVRIAGVVGWTKIKYISKPTTIAKTSETGERIQERQERETIQAINEAVSANNGMEIMVHAGSTIIKNVVGASKNHGYNGYGHEKYADVLLQLKNGKVLGVSMKMKKAPSLLGGGLDALYDLDPTYMKRVTQKALAVAIKSPKFELGSNKKLSDIFIEFTNHAFLERALKGTEKMGGPVHYMFIGPDSPTHTFNKGVLNFADSNLLSARMYAQKVKHFFIRIRRRDASQIFTNEIDKRGIPIFFRAAGGTSRARFVIDKVASGTALLVKDS